MLFKEMTMFVIIDYMNMNKKKSDLYLIFSYGIKPNPVTTYLPPCFFAR